LLRALRAADVAPAVVVGIIRTRRRNFERALRASGWRRPSRCSRFRVAGLGGHYRRELSDFIRRLDRQRRFPA